MMRWLTIMSLLALSACSADASAPAPKPGPSTESASRGGAGHPVVIELYQSQGCSSCPPAVAVVNALADRPDVLPLIFAVTYWDRLGWKDRFDDPAYTQRQWDYAHAQGRGNVQTPQVIVDGRVAVLGSVKADLDKAIAANPRGGSGPAIARSGNAVTIGAAKASGTATVWLVRYDPRTLNVAIGAGENNGRTIAHRDIVRELKPLGAWNGQATRLALPAGNPLYRSAILVQQGKGGPIVAAARI